MRSNIGGLTINVKTGHMQRKLLAIAKHAEALAIELGEIEDNYCENDGEKLEVIYTDGVPIKKVCAKCGERYHVR